jgi:dTDP-4-amino-4,6-dideoxygalactose transaminase
MKYKIPLFDLNYGPEEEDAALRTLRSKWITMGKNVALLEEEFAKKVKVKHAVAVSSCTAGLHLALRISGVKENDEVIVPSLTFVATVNAVRYVGATPVFADVTSYEDYSIDPVDVSYKITSNTRAIIPMHYAGFSCNMDEIMSISREYNLCVIEDAAHAPGAEYGGKSLGTIGDMGCFSFFSNKNITCAEGGMFVTNIDECAEKAKLMRAHGMTTLSYDRAKGHATDYDVLELGYNYRLDDIRGSLALAQLRKLESDISKREKLRKYYIEKLKQIDGIIIPYDDFTHKSSNYIFPILLKESNAERRNKIREELGKAGIQTSVHYPAVHKFTIYRQDAVELPKTDYVAENQITLPMYYSLDMKEIDYICSVLKDVVRNVKANSFG